MTSVTEITGAEAPAGASASSSNPDLRWYIVHAYSGMEKAVERNIQERIARSGMQDKFGRILVPTEEVVEMKNGQRKTTERRLFPGYVFVEMVMDDDTWHLVKHTSKVTGFVGGAKNRPAPISDEEVQPGNRRDRGCGERLAWSCRAVDRRTSHCAGVTRTVTAGCSLNSRSSTVNCHGPMFFEGASGRFGFTGAVGPPSIA